MIYCAIDPGWHGAYAGIDPDGLPLFHYKFTTWTDANNFLKGAKDVLFLLEAQHSFPGQNSKATFSQGGNYHAWKALLEINSISYVEIPAKRWQRAILGVIPAGTSKARALAYAQKRWPKLTLQKKDDGIVDALCMAMYLRLEQVGQV